LFSPLEVPLGTPLRGDSLLRSVTSGKTKLPDGILRDYMFDCLFPEVPHGQRPNFKGGKKEMR
jgi:hypothetical protein